MIIDIFLYFCPQKQQFAQISAEKCISITQNRTKQCNL